MFANLDPATRRAVEGAVSALPQVKTGAVPSLRIEKWLDHMASQDPRRIEWHVRRLGGIGGSEIASVMGVPGAYLTPTLIAQQKLMILPPMRPTSAMSRGVVAEEFMRDMFEGKSVETDAMDLEQTARKEHLFGIIDGMFAVEMNRRFGVGSWRARPDLEKMVLDGVLAGSGAPQWMKGSPDRIYEVTVGGYGHIVVVDFKAPSEKTALEIRDKPEAMEIWRVQVQHYARILSTYGYEPTSNVIAAFDYARAGTRPFIMGEWSSDYDLWARMEAAGNKFWNEYVLAGLVPSINLNAETPLPSVPDGIKEASERWAVGMAAVRAAEETAADLVSAIKEWGRGAGPAAHGLRLATVAGVDMARMKVVDDLDTEAALLQLLDIGAVSAEQVMGLRKGSEPMPPSDPRFMGIQRALQEKIESLAAVLSGPEDLSERSIDDIREIVGQIHRLANPQRPGPANVEQVKRLMLEHGLLPDRFSERSVSVARVTTKEAHSIFNKIVEAFKPALKDRAEAIVDMAREQLAAAAPDEDYDALLEATLPKPATLDPAPANRRQATPGV